ncbi:MAG: DUF4194 domain-containing protein [Roseburia sp.]|uniref:DUF4194 domain-containing protein n=1 Tax=Roseburia sp. 831b TaxID=1261635 RepID=UPI000952981D|nr:DUF4194 domain-containing protein [Roseburia sp. 831b]MCI5919622.1 DUF4194 domain-containing protein [Roseburia sp.]MDD6215777.1 DUF4194 domain-containing protein [Roseburia sp.]MDY5883437.1 DUF4194 domain-containing protein [Roseburia sp.]WVK71728.1 DUF4194 domain-containing protein [Roseburia sp. 831b]
MFEYYKELATTDQEKLKDVITQLLAQSFILERKYDRKKGRMVLNKDFYFCENHMEFLTQYFEVAGIRLQKNTELGSIYIQGNATLGEKLPKLSTIYLLLLKLLYDEKMASVSSSVNVVVTFAELNTKVGEFRLVKGLSSLSEVKRAFGILKKYQMVEVLDSLDELSEQTRILVYPCINLVLLQEDMVGLLQSFSQEEEEGELTDGEQ